MLKEVCYFCGEQKETREHVPPKCFFSPGHNLITVPSCKKHNNQKSDLDESMRIYLIGCSPNRIFEKVPLVTDKIWSGKHRSIAKMNKLSAKTLFNRHSDNTYSINHKSIKEGARINYHEHKQMQESILRGLYYHLNDEPWRKKIYIFPYSIIFNHSNDGSHSSKASKSEVKILKKIKKHYQWFFKLCNFNDFFKNSGRNTNNNEYSLIFRWNEYKIPEPLNNLVINVCLYDWYYFFGIFCDESEYAQITEFFKGHIPISEFNLLVVD